MERIRAATAAVAFVTDQPALAQQVVSLISDEATTVEVHASFDSLLTSQPLVWPDVVIVDDAMALDEAHSDAAQNIRQIRRRQPAVHIVFINSADENRGIELLHWGADDAVIKDSPALIPRLQAATRRARTVNAGTRIALGDIVFDREAHRVWCAGRQVDLTPIEYSVLDCLFWHAPAPVGVDTLADFVWGDQESTNRRTLVQVYVSYVRRKLSRSARVALRFVRGRGYQFAPRTDGEEETMTTGK